MAAGVVSESDMRRVERTPVASRDWMSRRGRDVVLLKQMAGVTQVGRRRHRVRM